MIKEMQNYSINSDDIAFGFSLQNTDVRGQMARLGPASADEIISRHGYDDVISNILGQVLALATLAGAALKFDGRLIVELRAEHGRFDLPLDFIVAEYSTKATIRGMAKINHGTYALLRKKIAAPSLQQLLGNGLLQITIDQGSGAEKYQGRVGLRGENLSQIAAHYFAQSEQIPTQIMLAVDKDESIKSHTTWRANGIMIQKVATGDYEIENEDLWREVIAKFNTLSEDELKDNTIGSGELLMRLFHENSPLINQSPKLLLAKCSCNHERLVSLMANLDKDEIANLVEDDGQIHALCEYCNSLYKIAPSQL